MSFVLAAQQSVGPQGGLDALFVVAAFGLAAFLFVVGFLAYRTSRAQKAMRRPLLVASTVSLVVDGLLLAVGIAEVVLRIAVPGGYFAARPRPGTTADPVVERLPDGQAWWEYRSARGFDSNGYREPFEQPESNSYRIVLLGDSVTFGVTLPVAETYPALLHQGLNSFCATSVQTYNLAVPGYSTLQERLSLERKGLKLKPHLVVLAAVPNDMEQYTVIGSMAYDVRLKDQDGVPVLDDLPLPDSVNRFLAGHSVLYQFLVLKGLKTFDTLSGRSQDHVNASVAEMERIRVLVDKAQANIVVVLFPTLGGLYAPESEADRLFFEPVRKWASESSVAVIDLRESLADRWDPGLGLEDGVHLSARGHRVVAEVLEEELLRLRFVSSDCRK